jgi:hypothetical protein
MVWGGRRFLSLESKLIRPSTTSPLAGASRPATNREHSTMKPVELPVALAISASFVKSGGLLTRTPDRSCR